MSMFKGLEYSNVDSRDHSGRCDMGDRSLVSSCAAWDSINGGGGVLTSLTLTARTRIVLIAFLSTSEKPMIATFLGV